ncbi:protein NRT1/ PTR FAMILY 5.5-like [Prosopis cineraria]|uniref:protein NRT1/ PTR FAMILY 5.5-like n=1 Tax=Prosopis cineraria TaxID=364024 RepID=UPI00240EDFCE|nr:protein NRT1/ PTR FAMILY 5.5-like [Prosopis cineraria]
MEKNTSFRRRLIDWLRNGFVLSKTVPFICGLVLSYSLAQNVVVIVLSDFLEQHRGARDAAALVNFLDGISAVFKVGVTHISEARPAGRLLVIISCAAAYTMGLMLLWVCASSTFDLSVVIFAIVLTALGIAGKSILADFFRYQLRVKIMKKYTKNNKKYIEELESIQFPFKVKLTSNILCRKYGRSFNTKWGPTQLKSKVIRENRNWAVVTDIVQTPNLWSVAASFAVLFIALYWLGDSGTSWPTRFEVSSLVMGTTYLLFFCGIFYYYPEDRPQISPLTTIYRVFKAAIKKRRESYPSSKAGYYSSNGNDQGFADSEDHFYEREDDKKVLLLPRQPSFLSFLDKAAVKNNPDGESGEREGNEEVCTAEQVRDVKSLYFSLPLGFTFFAYSLVSASGNTYFVQQASNLDSKVGNFDVPLVVFFVLKFVVSRVVTSITESPRVKEKVKPIWSIAVGMFCSVLCCIAAWLVERQRLSMVKFLIDPDEVISLSIMVLTPQYFLLGLMKGSAEHGLKTFVEDQVPGSMRTFVEPGIEMLLGIGKFSSILFAFIFHSWIKHSANDSHLDKYFLVLGSLSFVFFGIYVYCAKFVLSKLPKFEEPETKEENVGRMSEIEIEEKSSCISHYSHWHEDTKKMEGK